MIVRYAILGAAVAIAAVACSPDTADTAAPGVSVPAAPFQSTYRPMASSPTAIIGATILTGSGDEIRDGAILMRDGRIVSVGTDIEIPENAVIIDGTGRWVTPGLIDSHSHLGAMAPPSVAAHRDVNENVNPNTAEVWIEHSIWPQDPGFDLARAGGVTSLLILPGSANLFGGRTVALRNRPGSVSVQEMKFPGAPYGLKMACGENPKGRYGAQGRSPATRMGNVAGYRAAWIEAGDYSETDDGRDLALETLAGVLDGEILVQTHCYRADEMAVMLDVGREFGYRTTAFHHAVEAYKIAPLLREHDVCVATWAGRWGFKMEAADAIEENAAMLHAAGVCVAIHSDDARIVQRLNVEASVALSAGRRAGIDISDAEAIAWITANPARIMGIDEMTGTLEPGKLADVVLWSANPFSIYALPDLVFLDGAPVFDRSEPDANTQSDLMAGRPGSTL